MQIITAPAPKQAFNGDKKQMAHFMLPYEKWFLQKALPRVPLQMGSAHLTLMTVIWSLGIVMAGYLARGDIRWLWAFSAFILLQYITDMLDGEVGRARNNGLIKWGFYMDHFLDYIFLCAIVTGYSFLLPSTYIIAALLCLTFFAGFMVHTFLDYAITNNFKISCNKFGVSEMRCVLVLFNFLLMITGKGLLAQVYPYVVIAAFFGLISLVYTSQKSYVHIDAIQQAQQDDVIEEGAHGT